MDTKDKKIIEQLILNSRIPIKQLAKKVQISREVCIYRIKKLKENIITHFHTIINTSYLRYERYECFIQLKGISSKKEKEFIKTLEQNDFITYLSPIIGKWNIVFDIFAKNNEHLEELIKTILQPITQNLETYTIIKVGNQEGVFLSKLLGKHISLQKPKSTKNIKLDKTDKKILSLLSTNSRIEYKELSNKLNLTPNAIKYRIKNLEKSNIIQAYSISLNLKNLGYDLYNLQLKLKNIKNQELTQFLKTHPKTFYYYKYFGHENWDMDIGILVKNTNELRDFILEIREKFNIKIYDFYIINETKKFHLPKGIFKQQSSSNIDQEQQKD